MLVLSGALLLLQLAPTGLAHRDGASSPSVGVALGQSTTTDATLHPGAEECGPPHDTSAVRIGSVFGLRDVRQLRVVVCTDEGDSEMAERLASEIAERLREALPSVDVRTGKDGGEHLPMLVVFRVEPMGDKPRGALTEGINSSVRLIDPDGIQTIVYTHSHSTKGVRWEDHAEETATTFVAVYRKVNAP